MGVGKVPSKLKRQELLKKVCSKLMKKTWFSSDIHEMPLDQAPLRVQMKLKHGPVFTALRVWWGKHVAIT